MTDSKQVIPTHLGFILDGNRRWARMHSIPEFDGHLAGYDALREVIRAAFDLGVQYVSIYAFSTENWKRDKKEVSNLMKLVSYAFSHDLGSLVKDRIKVRFLGRRDGLGGKVLTIMEKAEATTAAFSGRTLAVCFNYGGQQEIVDAARQCVRDGLAEDEIDETAITARLYAPDVPPPDMIVRTSGEQRLSNFMLWRSGYSEFMFLDKYWPDMTRDDVVAIMAEFTRRQRRFGS